MAPALLEVFVGTGTGGTVLASQNFDLAGYVDNTTPTTVNFSTPSAVVAKQVYTFRVSLVNPGPRCTAWPVCAPTTATPEASQALTPGSTPTFKPCWAPRAVCSRACW